MSTTTLSKLRPLLPALACSMVLLGAIAVIHPAGEIPLGDEISFASSAHLLARTGHVTYVGEINAMAGWQLYWGAAAIRLFGYSFLVLRWSIAAIAAASAFLLHRIFVRCGVGPALSVAGTLTFCLSSLFLSMATVFYTDVAGVFAVLVCLYACLRALEAESLRRKVMWIALATIGSSVLGSARQYAWLAGLVMVPSVLWLERKNRTVVRAGAGLWTIGLGMDCAMQFWFMHQPYTNREGTLLLGMTPRRVEVMGLEGLGVLMEIGLLLLPVSLMFLPVFARKRLPRANIVSCLLFVAGVCGLWRIHSLGVLEIPYLGPSSDWPVGQSVKVVLSALDVLGLLALLTTALTQGEAAPTSPQGETRLTERGLLVVVLPFVCAYMVALLPRAYNPGLWDRYLLAPAAMLLLCVLRLYQGGVSRPSLTLALALCIGAYSTAFLHDSFVAARAKLDALQELTAKGIPRTAVTGDWPYDIETELQIRPYVTSDGIRLPKGVVPPASTHYGIDHCEGFQCGMVPDVVPRYAVSTDATRALPGFVPVPYRGWVTPAGAFYVTRFP